MATRDVTLTDIESTVADNDIVLLDFWASWCGPCRQFGPVFEKASEDNTDIVFGRSTPRPSRPSLPTCRSPPSRP